MNKKIVSIICSVTMVILAMAVGLTAFAVQDNNSVKGNHLSASTGISTLASSDEIIEPKNDSLLNGDSMSFSLTPVFKEAQWNGRVETKLHLGGVSFIYINVDPRNVLTNDDIIIEYRNFYRDSRNNEINQKLKNFHADITFYTEKGAIIYQSCEKSEDSQAGFTRYSRKGSVKYIEVTIKVTTLSGIERTAQYYFGKK